MRALSERDAHPFAIRWRPYLLDPSLPPEGVDRAAYLAAKFGAGRDIDAAHSRIAAMGAEVGLAYRFDRITRTPSTLDAHRLVHWAAVENLQTRTAMELSAATSSSARTSPTRAVLTAAATEAGLDPAAVARLLAGDADRAEVAAEARAARDMGVTGVPTFILGGQYVLTGAQPVDVWRKLIDELEAASVPSGHV